MGKGNRMNALLVEILIAVLFFALSATVILETFVAAHVQSERAGARSGAMADVQNWAGQVYAAEDVPALLSAAGFAETENIWTLGCEDYDLTVALTEEPTAAGTLLTAEIQAADAEEILISIPCVKYIPGEVAA